MSEQPKQPQPDERKLNEVIARLWERAAQAVEARHAAQETQDKERAA